MNMREETRKILLVSEMAFKNVAVLLICVLLGLQLDNYFNTKPLWVIVSSLLAVAYLVFSIIKLGSKE